MMIMLLIFSSLLKAEDLSTEKYCFNSQAQMEMAKKSFHSIQVPSDEARPDDRCLTILMRPHRFELIHKYMTSSFPEAVIAFSTEDLKSEPCRLKVEKIKIKSAKELELKSDQDLTLEQIDTASSDTEVSHIQTLKDFELTYDQDQIKGTCRFINSQRYEISLAVRKNPKPITPVVLPPGTIPTFNPPPQDQETMTLQTQILLSKGERIEIGSVLKKSTNTKHSLDITPSIDASKSEQTFNEKVFLSFK